MLTGLDVLVIDLQDIGARAMIVGELARSSWSVRLTPAVKIAGLFALSSVVVTLASERALARPRPLLDAATAATRSRSPRSMGVSRPHRGGEEPS